MTTRLTLAALLALLPTTLAAQSRDNTAGVVRPPTAAALTPASAPVGRRTAVCDGSEARRDERRRRTASILATGVVAAQVIATAANVSRGLDDPHRGNSVLRRQVLITGTGVPLLMASLAYGRPPGSSFWEQTISSMKVGETRSADVLECLSEPRATTSAGAEERWTYAWRQRDHLNTVSLTFKDSVLVEVLRARLRLPLQQDFVEIAPPDVLRLMPLPPDLLPPR